MREPNSSNHYSNSNNHSVLSSSNSKVEVGIEPECPDINLLNYPENKISYNAIKTYWNSTHQEINDVFRSCQIENETSDYTDITDDIDIMLTYSFEIYNGFVLDEYTVE